MNEARPEPTAARIGTVDALRGFALFGIAVVNAFSFLNIVAEPAPAAMDGPVGGAVVLVVRLLFQGKFYPTFAFLFGFGIWLQVSRGDREDAEDQMRRRLRVLGAAGLAHGVFLWTGDILLPYAILGAVLPSYAAGLSARRMLNRGLLLAGVIALGSVMLFAPVALLESTNAGRSIVAEAQHGLTAESASERYRTIRDREIYSKGSFAQITVLRVKRFLVIAVGSVVLYPHIFGFLLLGFAAGSAGWFTAASPPVRLLWAFPAGLILTVLAMAGSEQRVGEPFHATRAVAAYGAGEAGAILLAAAYVTAVSLRPGWTGVLAAPGRMALTNYLTQSLIFGVLAYGYGFGLVGKTGSVEVGAAAVCLFAIQTAWSHLWLRTFRFGPLEWIWRWLSYGRRPPMWIAVP